MYVCDSADSSYLLPVADSITVHAQWDIAQFHEQYYHNLCNHGGHVRNYSRVIRALYNNMRDTLLHVYYVGEGFKTVAHFKAVCAV